MVFNDMLKKLISSFIFCLLPATAFAFEDIEILLKQDERPPGVVIEITSGDPLYLKKIIKELQSDINNLQQKFKDLPVAIVSHARESLLLATKETKKHKGFENKIKTLARDNNTTVHVCGTYASWFNVSEEEFPEYINVSPAGPVQVDDYTDLGYVLIEL